MSSSENNYPRDLGLDLLPYQEQLKLSNEDGQTRVWDILRKKWIVLTPEEHVRQLLIHYMIDSKGISKNRLSVEKQITVNDVKKRFDLCIHDSTGHPNVLIECKAPTVAIDQKVFDQVSYYNVALQVPYLLVTNGRLSYLCVIHHDSGTYSFLDTFDF